jgi:FKBP-type peptidyl-prolyl cis-trans isomerase 2
LVGGWVRATTGRGGSRQVRILEVHDNAVVVDTNHRGAGQSMELKVKLVGIQVPGAGQGAGVS